MQQVIACAAKDHVIIFWKKVAEGIIAKPIFVIGRHPIRLTVRTGAAVNRIIPDAAIELVATRRADHGVVAKSTINKVSVSTGVDRVIIAT